MASATRPMLAAIAMFMRSSTITMLYLLAVFLSDDACKLQGGEKRGVQRIRSCLYSCDPDYSTLKNPTIRTV